MSYWVAGGLGELYYWLNPGHSRHAVANLAVITAQHPASPVVRRLARRSFRYYALYLVDVVRQLAMVETNPDEAVITHGWHELDRALALGRGAIIVAIHCGSWDRAATLLSRRGYRAHLVVDTLPMPWLNALIHRMREQYGLGIIPVEQPGGLRAIYAALARNEIVVLLIDRPLRSGGLPVSLFGRPTRLPAGPASLVRRTGAALLHAYLVRRPGLVSLAGAIEPILVGSGSHHRALDERWLTEQIIDHIERLILAHPEQWYMFRPMWPEEGADRPCQG